MPVNADLRNSCPEEETGRGAGLGERGGSVTIASLIFFSRRLPFAVVRGMSSPAAANHFKLNERHALVNSPRACPAQACDAHRTSLTPVQ